MLKSKINSLKVQSKISKISCFIKIVKLSKNQSMQWAILTFYIRYVKNLTLK